MGIEKSIKSSFFFGLLIRLKDILSKTWIFRINLENKEPNPDKVFKTWMDTSLINKLLGKIDDSFSKLDKKIYESIEASKILGPFLKRKKTQNEILKNSLIYGIINKIKLNGSWIDSLVYIPASYFLVDYIIRRTRGLSVLGSVWDELLLIFLVGIIVLKRIFSGGKVKYNFTPMGIPAGAYIIMGLCHVFIIAPSFGIAVEGFRAVFQHILWYFVATQFIRDIKDSTKVLNLMVTTGLFMGIHALYQCIRKVPMPGNWVDATENISTRAFSIVGSPNILGVIFVLLIPIGLSMFFANKNKYMKLFYFASVGFMTLGLLLTLSRGAWLAFAFGVFIFILSLNPRLIIPFFGLLGAFILFGGSLSERLLFMMSPVYFAKSGQGGRLYRWEIGLKMWERNRFWGVGLGRYGGAVAINNQLAPFYLDNYYLKTLTEMGIYGILGLAFIIVLFLILSIKIIRNQDEYRNKILCIGLFSGALGVLVQNFVENIFEVPAMVIYFWIIVAVISTFAPKRSLGKVDPR